MSYIYLLDRFDELGYQDLSTTLCHLDIEQWFQQPDLLLALHAMMTTISTHQDINPPKSNTGSHIPLDSFKKQLVQWLKIAQCPYIDLFTPSSSSASSKTNPSQKQDQNLDYLDQEDSIGLIIEFITAEFQTINYTKKLDKLHHIQTQISKSSLTSSELSTISQSSQSSLNINTININNKSEIDQYLKLHATTTPSLVQYIHHLLHTSTLQFLDIDMYSALLNQQRQNNSHSNTSAFLAASLASITPQTYSPQSLIQFGSKLDAILFYYHSQIEKYTPTHQLHPILSSISSNLLSNSKENHIFSAIQKSIRSLAPAELKIVSQQLDGLYKDYKTRHRMILTKMLTQTQTFLLTLKLQYLQIQREKGPTKKVQNVKTNFSESPAVAAAAADAVRTPLKSNKPNKNGKNKTQAASFKKGIILEDGVADDFSSGDDDEDTTGPRTGNNVTNIGELEVKNDDYSNMVKSILQKYKSTTQLLTHLQPVSISDLFTLAPYISLLLQQGNEKQLHRPRSKFQLQGHPKTKTLQSMPDRGGRLK